MMVDSVGKDEEDDVEEGVEELGGFRRCWRCWRCSANLLKGFGRC